MGGERSSPPISISALSYPRSRARARPQLPIHHVDIALAAVVGGEDHAPAIWREGGVGVAALVFLGLISVVAAQHFKHLLPVAQMNPGDAAGPRLAVCDHGLAGGVQIVVRVHSPWRVVDETSRDFAGQVVPAAEGPFLLPLPAAV